MVRDKAEIFISHAWKNKLKDFYDCLVKLLTDEKEKKADDDFDVYIWMSMLCVNQHSDFVEMCDDDIMEFFLNTFQKTIQNIGRVIFKEFRNELIIDLARRAKGGIFKVKESVLDPLKRWMLDESIKLLKDMENRNACRKERYSKQDYEKVLTSVGHLFAYQNKYDDAKSILKLASDERNINHNNIQLHMKNERLSAGHDLVPNIFSKPIELQKSQYNNLKILQHEGKENIRKLVQI